MQRNVGGPHIQLITDDSRKLFYKPAGCLKVCHPAFDVNLIREFVGVNPEAPVCARLIDDSANFSNMRAKTQEAIRLFEPAIQYVRDFYIEVLPNEKYTEGDELHRLADESIPCARDISEAGARPVILNLPVGNPANPSDMTRIASEVDYVCSILRGAVGYHNYTVPGNQLSLDLDLRHRTMAQYLFESTRWWLNEGMYDHGIIDGRLAGWRDASFHQSAEDVSRYLRRLLQEVSKDKTVIGDTPFGAGPASDWLSFQYDNEPVITQVFTELYEVANDIQIGQGFRRMIPYLGVPLENEVYHFAGTPMETSLAVFENGVANWYKASNETVGQRSDGAIFTDKGNHGDGTSVWQVYP